MEVALDEDGQEVRATSITLTEARDRNWTCPTCPTPVPLYPQKWPCPLCTRTRRDPRCRHPPFCWRTRDGGGHQPPCGHVSEVVVAEIGKRGTCTERGVPREGPDEIRFASPQLIRSAGQGETGSATGRSRHVRRADAVRRRSDHVATSTSIASACEAFIAYPEGRQRPLSVPGVPEWADTYRTVFKNLRLSEGREGSTHIWWADVRTRRMPGVDRPVVTFDMSGGCRISVDRGGWGRAAEAFASRVVASYAGLQRALDEGSRDVWINLLVFAYGRLEPEGLVRVTDARMLHLMIEQAPRRRSPGA